MKTAPGYRLVADIAAASDKAFDAALAEQAETTGSTQATKKADRLGAAAGAARQALHHRHRPGPWRHRRRRRRRQRHGREVDHAGIRAGAEEKTRRNRSLRCLPDARKGRFPAARRARPHRPPARGRPVHIDPRRHDQAEGNPRRDRLYGFRQGVGRRGSRACGARKPLRPACRHRDRGRESRGRRHSGRSNPSRNPQLSRCASPAHW